MLLFFSLVVVAFYGNEKRCFSSDTCYSISPHQMAEGPKPLLSSSFSIYEQ